MPGALSDARERSDVLISPLPSMGLPRASTTRPRSSGPTGTSAREVACQPGVARRIHAGLRTADDAPTISPVRLTVSPSLMRRSDPKIETPLQKGARRKQASASGPEPLLRWQALRRTRCRPRGLGTCRGRRRRTQPSPLQVAMRKGREAGRQGGTGGDREREKIKKNRGASARPALSAAGQTRQKTDRTGRCAGRRHGRYRHRWLRERRASVSSRKARRRHSPLLLESKSEMATGAKRPADR
jgi:hypothetical protein